MVWRSQSCRRVHVGQDFCVCLITARISTGVHASVTAAEGFDAVTDNGDVGPDGIFHGIELGFDEYSCSASCDKLVGFINMRSAARAWAIQVARMRWRRACQNWLKKKPYGPVARSGRARPAGLGVPKSVALMAAS